MNQKKIILVTGATGAQGGSVARALLAENKFTVRILTRNPASLNAIILQSAGAEIVKGNLDDTESLKAAMKDCYAVFGVTDFWEHVDREYELGRNLMDAVNQSGIKHFVFSSLENYGKLSNGQLPVPHYDIKAVLQDYAKQLQLNATFVQASFYYENFLYFFPLQHDGNMGFYFEFPQGDTKLATVSVEDYGAVVSAVFNHPLQYIGRTVRAVGSDKTCNEYAAIMSRVLIKNIYFRDITRDQYAAGGFHFSEELANMFEVQRRYIPNRQLDLIESYGLNPGMQTFESWLKKNTHKFETQMKIVSGAIV